MAKSVSGYFKTKKVPTVIKLGKPGGGALMALPLIKKEEKQNCDFLNVIIDHLEGNYHRIP